MQCTMPFWNIDTPHLKLVITWPQVIFWKVTRSLELIKPIINPRSGYLFFIVTLFNCRYWIHIWREFFFTNSTGAPHGDILGLIKPLSTKSLSWGFNSFNSAETIRQGGIDMRFVSGSKSMPKSISHPRGIPGRSLGKTSGNSLTTGTDSVGGTSESRSWTLTLWYKHPLEIILQDFK